jgi:Cyclic nucleotide-binding domain
VSLDGRADDLHRFALRCSAEAVEGHGLASAFDRAHDDATAMLVDSLLDRSDREARMAMRAAALLDGAPEIAVALENLSVTDPAQRANAIEVIDSVGRRDVVRPLLTMWDGTAPRTDVPQAIERLLTDPDPWIRACAELAHAGATAGASPRPRAGGTMSETLTTLSPMERVLFLRKVPLFAALPPPDLQPIAAIAVEQAFDDGETIASQGEIGDEMHIIVSGEIAVVATGDGQDRVLAVRTAGDAVGEMSVLTNEPRVADLIARGPVRLLSIERRRFESILRERPETSLGVIRVLCARLAEAPAAQAGATRDGAQAGDAAENGEP